MDSLIFWISVHFTVTASTWFQNTSKHLDTLNDSFCQAIISFKCNCNGLDENTAKIETHILFYIFPKYKERQ